MRESLVVVALVVLVACGRGNADPATITIGEGAPSPEAAVEELRSLLVTGDFDAAGSLAVPDQAALASLAEGAPFGQVADALERGDALVASNFWAGFAQGVGEVLTDDMVIEQRGSTTKGEVEFFLVGVTSGSGMERQIVTRDIDGHRIDLFASFGAGLAERLISPVDLLLGASTDDSRIIMTALRDVVPSLLLAAGDDSLSPGAVQGVLQLVEMITRVG